MNILLVNDDGYGAKGILLLEKLLKKYGDVYVVAPLHHQSGKSCSIVFGVETPFIKYDDHHYALDAKPANCSSFGIHGLNKKIDLVVSGCNDGLNTSIDTMYSGTIGACDEAMFSGIPCIAISCDSNFDLVEKYFDYVMDYIFNNDLITNKFILNVNFPKGDKVKGIKLTSLHIPTIKYHYYVNESSEKHGRYGVFDEVKKNSDAYQIEHGYVSITPLSMTTYNPAYLRELSKKIKSKK